MSVKAYFMTWGLVGVAALLLFVTGNFTMLTAVVFGFIAFGMTFMGMMNVLPLAVSHPAPVKVEKAPKPVTVRATTEAPARAFNTWKSA